MSKPKDINAEIMRDVEAAANKFQDEHQWWFDRNTEDASDPDIIHDHYIPTPGTGVFGFTIKDKSNMPIEMKNGLTKVIKIAIERYSAK